MKLYLSSYRVPQPDKLFELIGKDPSEIKGAIVTNAKDRRTSEEQALKLKNLQDDLASIGLTDTVVVNLRSSDVPFDEIDYVFAAGGNTFALNQAIQDTGFKDKLVNYLNSGGVYVGESAGAIVAGPSLRGFEGLDNYFEGAPFSGMGITGTIIVPHNDSLDPQFANRAPDIKKANPGIDVLPLNDNEDWIVNE